MWYNRHYCTSSRQELNLLNPNGYCRCGGVSLHHRSQYKK
nr:MAG TPA: hypothetical protein [Caudoviricetes sp.]DAU75527.1 MAG TPA: hypothetical protein [Caudoviricetes sp.]